MRAIFQLLVVIGLFTLAGCTTRSDRGKNKDYDVPKSTATQPDGK